MNALTKPQGSCRGPGGSDMHAMRNCASRRRPVLALTLTLTLITYWWWAILA